MNKEVMQQILEAAIAQQAPQTAITEALAQPVQPAESNLVELHQIKTAQPVQPTTRLELQEAFAAGMSCRPASVRHPPNLIEAAEAVLGRWNSPKWAWAEQGHTADLMHALRRALDAQPVKPDPASCKKCAGQMKAGLAIEQTFKAGLPDFPGSDTRGITISPGGPGNLVQCLKCEVCGWSVTADPAQPVNPKR